MKNIPKYRRIYEILMVTIITGALCIRQSQPKQEAPKQESSPITHTNRLLQPSRSGMFLSTPAGTATPSPTPTSTSTPSPTPIPTQKVTSKATPKPTTKVTTTQKKWTGISKTDEQYLLKIGKLEAGGESVTCIAMVMRTVINRVKSPRFPNTIREVLYQPKQFSSVGKHFNGTKPNSNCYKALEMIKNGWDKSQGALYFESCKGSSWHSRNLKLITQDGHMRFYKYY